MVFLGFFDGFAMVWAGTLRFLGFLGFFQCFCSGNGSGGDSREVWNGLGISGELWDVLGDSGMLWEALRGSGRLCEGLGSSGRLY